jgi:hypothetical protein
MPFGGFCTFRSTAVIPELRLFDSKESTEVRKQ